MIMISLDYHLSVKHFKHFVNISSIYWSQHLEVDGEDGVAAGGVRVHGGGRGDPVGDPLLEQLRHLRDAIHHVHRQALHSVLLNIEKHIYIINIHIDRYLDIISTIY